MRIKRARHTQRAGLERNTFGADEAEIRIGVIWVQVALHAYVTGADDCNNPTIFLLGEIDNGIAVYYDKGVVGEVKRSNLSVAIIDIIGCRTVVVEVYIRKCNGRIA